jgi:hypothetical protein
MVASTLAARNHVVAAVCTDEASNDVAIPDQLQTLPLPRQTASPIVIITCVVHTASLALGDLLKKSISTKPYDIRTILAALADYTSALFSVISRL